MEAINFLIPFCKQSFEINGKEYNANIEEFFNYEPYVRDKIIWSTSNYLRGELKDVLSHLQTAKNNITLHIILTAPNRDNCFDKLYFWLYIIEKLLNNKKYGLLNFDCKINIINADFLISEKDALIIKIYDSRIYKINFDDLIKFV